MLCIIVRRGEHDTYERLYQAFGNRVPVVWDRRRPSRPASVDEVLQREERRFAAPLSWTKLAFLVADRSEK